MNIFTINMVSTLVDFIGFCLCIITILYIIKNKTLLKEQDLKNTRHSDSVNFNTEVFLQQLQLECENTFKKLSDNFNDELKNIEDLLKQRETGCIKKELPENKKQKRLNTVYRKNNKVSSCDHLVKPYGEIVKMVDMGLSINKISKQVKIPRGEIEHIFRLKGKYVQQGEKFA